MSINTGKRGAVVISSYQFEGIKSAKWGDKLPNLAEFETAILDMTSIGLNKYKTEMGYIRRKIATINGKESKTLLITLKRIDKELKILFKSGFQLFYQKKLIK